MTDLLQSARMFEASSKTQRACAYLQDLAQGKDPDESGMKTLAWVGNLLPQVDWGYSGKLKEQASNELPFEATCARPAFFASLVKLRKRFHAAGMESEGDVAEFLGALYAFLLSGGQDPDSRSALGTERMDIAATFLYELAHGILRRYGSRMPERPNLLGV